MAENNQGTSQNANVETQKHLLQSDALYQYILETSVYPREPECLKELRDLTAKHPHAIIAIPAHEAQFLMLLLKLINAKKTLEIGVFTGYSLLCTALALPTDGKVIGIDINREPYDLGRPIIESAGIAHKIDFREGPALPILDEFIQQVLFVQFLEQKVSTTLTTIGTCSTTGSFPLYDCGMIEFSARLGTPYFDRFESGGGHMMITAVLPPRSQFKFEVFCRRHWYLRRVLKGFKARVSEGEEDKALTHCEALLTEYTDKRYGTKVGGI